MKKSPSIWHECLDGMVMLLMEMRNIQEKKFVGFVCVCFQLEIIDVCFVHMCTKATWESLTLSY